MTTIQDRAKAFREQAKQDYPASWRPDEGAPNPLVGEVVRYDQGHSDYGTKLIIVVRDENGKEWSVWAIHAALLAALQRERPNSGELIYIDQQGTRTSNASGRQYTAYKVKVDRVVAPDFDQIPGLATGEALDAVDAAAESDAAAKGGDENAIPF